MRRKARVLVGGASLLLLVAGVLWIVSYWHPASVVLSIRRHASADRSGGPNRAWATLPFEQRFAVTWSRGSVSILEDRRSLVTGDDDSRIAPGQHLLDVQWWKENDLVHLADGDDLFPPHGWMAVSADWVSTMYAAPIGRTRPNRRMLSRRMLSRAVSVPICAAVAAGIVTLTVMAVLEIVRHQKMIGHCRRCGYDLRASPGRCPECGAEPAAAGRPDCAGSAGEA